MESTSLKIRRGLIDRVSVGGKSLYHPYDEDMGAVQTGVYTLICTSEFVCRLEVTENQVANGKRNAYAEVGANRLEKVNVFQISVHPQSHTRENTRLLPLHFGSPSEGWSPRSQVPGSGVMRSSLM